MAAWHWAQCATASLPSASAKVSRMYWLTDNRPAGTAAPTQGGPTAWAGRAPALACPAPPRLDQGLEALMQAGGRWVTVTGASRKVVGVLGISDIVRGYREALLHNAGQIARVSEAGAVTVEERLGADSPLAGQPLRESELPPGAIVVSVQRGEHMIFAAGSTVLEVGDLVSALTSPTTEEATRRMIRGTDEPPPPIVERGSQMV